MKKTTYILSIVFLIFSCSNIDNNYEINIQGNWQIEYIKSRLSLNEYRELYIDKDNIYTFSDAGIIYIRTYNINDNMTIYFDEENTNNNPKVSIDGNKLIFVYSDSTKIEYKYIDKGILPKVYAQDKELKDCYYISFFTRMEQFGNPMARISR